MTRNNSNGFPCSLFKLPNGLQVAFWPVSGVEVVCFGIKLRAGSWYETDLKKGVFHFLEHSLVQGSRKFPSFRRLSRRQEEIGLRMYNGVSGESSFFQWSLPKENFSKGLELLSEYVFNPLFPQDGIEREREIIIQEYQDYWDSPYNRFDAALFENFWGKDHPYTLNPLGTKEGIMTITRDDLVEIHQKWYQPQNMILVVVGDLREKEARRKIERVFDVRPTNSFLPESSFGIPKFRKKFFYRQENFKQVNFSVSFPTFGYKERREKEQIALVMVYYMLVESRWSRLIMRLREGEPLAYSLGGSVMLYPQGGFFDISASFSPENTRKILWVIYEEIEKIKTSGVRNSEFERAKKYFRYQFLMSFDTVYDIATNLITDIFQKGKVFLPKDVIREIDRIRKDDLERIAREVFVYDRSTTGVMAESGFLEKLKSVGLPWGEVVNRV